MIIVLSCILAKPPKCSSSDSSSNAYGIEAYKNMPKKD